MSIQINVHDCILFEDAYIMVLNKPSSLMVEPDRNNHPNLLQQVRNYLRRSLQKNEEVYAQHIHRLDRPVSGVILFAKQRTVLKNLSEQFAERRVQKYYQALTANGPQELKGTLESWHRKQKKKAIMMDEYFAGAERAILHYECEHFSENKFLWNIELHTGKYHQIRAQLSAAGCPIIGDSLYNSSVSYSPDSIALHACKLVFFHPITNERMAIESMNPFSM